MGSLNVDGKAVFWFMSTIEDFKNLKTNNFYALHQCVHTSAQRLNVSPDIDWQCFPQSHIHSGHCCLKKLVGHQKRGIVAQNNWPIKICSVAKWQDGYIVASL